MARKLAVFLVLFGGVLATSTAFGQEQRGTDVRRDRSSGVRVSETSGSSYTAVFDDDLLGGAGFGFDAPIIRVRPVSTFGLLIRPRTHFVPELVKSVEKI